jgi:hypothetical protein
MSRRFRLSEPIAVASGLIGAAAVPAAFFSALYPQWFMIFYAYSFIFVVVLGTPAFLILRPFRPGHWWSVMSVGGLLGAGAELLFKIQGTPYIPELLTFAVLGSGSALVFWLIWIGSLPRVAG